MAEQQSYYEIDGVQYPRVTNILRVLDKPGLARWRGRVGNQEADRISKVGQNVGTAFHEIAADIGRGIHLQRGWKPQAEFREMAYSYIDWLHKYIGSIQAVEERVYSMTRKYAGTLDLRATVRNDTYPSIFDVKTSNNTSVDWPLQLSAYKQAKEELGDHTERRIIVRVPKTAPFVVEMYEYKDHEEDEMIWNYALACWDWAEKDKKRHAQAKVIGGL